MSEEGPQWPPVSPSPSNTLNGYIRLDSVVSATGVEENKVTTLIFGLSCYESYTYKPNDFSVGKKNVECTHLLAGLQSNSCLWIDDVWPSFSLSAHMSICRPHSVHLCVKDFEFALLSDYIIFSGFFIWM